MKRILTVFTLVFFGQISSAQNVGIGTKEPVSKLQVTGNLLVSEPLVFTSSAPTPAQTQTMINGSTLNFQTSDSVVRFFDPGGPAGNYLANLTANTRLSSASNVIGYEVIFETMDLGTGDSLIIGVPGLFGVFPLMSVGNGYTTTGKWIFQNTGTNNIDIEFKSNADASTGAGFSILVKRLYNTPSLLPAVENYIGKSMFFDTKTGSLRSGLITNDSRGLYSTAIGQRTVASGAYSFAAGTGSEASGTNSIAIGENCFAFAMRSVAIGNATASGNNAVALGDGTASGGSSFAAGSSTIASGSISVALGSSSEAAGTYSTAMGRRTTAYGYATTAVGMYNNPLFFAGQTSVTPTTPMFIVGNGEDGDVTNAMVVLKNGNVGIGENIPDASLHIKHAAGSGILLENINDGNKWRIYSASGDNNLTFYNNAGTEIADIDDITGTFSALSDARYKKNILDISPVLPAVMQLRPKKYHFNWQENDEQLQLGFLAQEAYKLFPELVSYEKEKDLYKMNYAGFSTVAIKAIQEQQAVIKELQNQIEVIQKQLDELKKNK